MKKSTRRNFINRSMLAGAAGILPAWTFAEKKEMRTIEQKNKQNGLVFLFQGDSITDGNRGRNADPNHIMGHGYAFAVSSRIAADFPAAGNVFYNRGISGNTLTDLQVRWQTDTIALHPDILSILIGINDTAATIDGKAGAGSIDDFEIVYRNLLQNTRTARPETIFVLGLPFVYPVGQRKDKWEQWQTNVRQKIESVRKLADDFNAVLVDYPAVFNKAMKTAPVEYWIWDGIHPTIGAHELMAREWIKQTSRILPFLKKYV